MRLLRSHQRLHPFVPIQIHLAAHSPVPALPLSTTRRIATPPRSVYRDPASPTSTATSRTSSTAQPTPYLPPSSLDIRRRQVTSSNSPPCAPSCRTSSTRACYYIFVQIYTGLCSRSDTRLRLLFKKKESRVSSDRSNDERNR